MLLRGAPKRVLILVDDAVLAELLAEALLEVGHLAEVARVAEVVNGSLACTSFDVVIVDLDTWSRREVQAVEKLRRDTPTTTVIALLPCGGIASDFTAVAFDVAIEKPARLKTLLLAVDAALVRTAP
ncbi:MAG: hypothetical protein ABI321_15330 [Polyangia bacterium]